MKSEFKHWREEVQGDKCDDHVIEGKSKDRRAQKQFTQPHLREKCFTTLAIAAFWFGGSTYDMGIKRGNQNSVLQEPQTA